MASFSLFSIFNLHSKGVKYPKLECGNRQTFSGEYNPPKSDKLHFYQIWILPEKNGLKPGYEQKRFAPAEKSGKLKLVASSDARSSSIKINQDVSVFNSILNQGEQLSYNLNEKRYGWIQVVKGKLEINGETLQKSDGAESRLLRVRETAPF